MLVRLTTALFAMSLMSACASEQPVLSTPPAHAPQPATKELSAADVRRVVMTRSDSLRNCYQREAVQSRDLSGVVTATWLVEPAGNVTKVAISASTLHNATVEGCVLREVKALRFPRGASMSTIVWPFRFGVVLDLDSGT